MQDQIVILTNSTGRRYEFPVTPFQLESLLDRVKKRLYLMDFEGIDSLRGVVCQLRPDHCRMKLLAMGPLLSC
jgi:hypothetical protein